MLTPLPPLTTTGSSDDSSSSSAALPPPPPHPPHACNLCDQRWVFVVGGRGDEWGVTLAKEMLIRIPAVYIAGKNNNLVLATLSLTHSLTHSLAHPLTHPLTHSPGIMQEPRGVLHVLVAHVPQYHPSKYHAK